MLDLLAFKATDVPAKNLIENGDFSDRLSGWRRFGGSAYIPEFIDGGIVFITSYYNYRVQNPPSADIGDIIYLSAETKVDGENNQALLGISDSFDSGRTIFKNEEFKRNSIIKEISSTDFEIRIGGGGGDENEFSYIRHVISFNMTKIFGKGNEPTIEQMDMLLEQFPNSWFDGTKNLFNAKEFINNYHKKTKELENAIISLGGELP